METLSVDTPYGHRIIMGSIFIFESTFANAALLDMPTVNFFIVFFQRDTDGTQLLADVDICGKLHGDGCCTPPIELNVVFTSD